jgi:hypothetical protein
MLLSGETYCLNTDIRKRVFQPYQLINVVEDIANLQTTTGIPLYLTTNIRNLVPVLDAIHRLMEIASEEEAEAANRWIELEELSRKYSK